MSSNSGELMTGGLLLSGGVLAGYAHVVHPMHPSDPALLFQHAAKTQSAHTVLFAGVFVLLLALRGHMGNDRNGARTVALGTLLLSTGILLSDMLHCVLEFSIFPMLMRSIPYAAVAIVESTYRSIPLSILQSAGQWLLALGAFITGIGMIRGPRLRRWAALLLCISAGLMASTLLRLGTEKVEPQFIAWIYFSIAIMGLSILFRSLSAGGSPKPEGRLLISAAEEKIKLKT
jgi:hypothetical protein